MPVNRSAAGFPGTANMLANEPRYPIGTAQYASSVDRAVGRIVMWKLNNGQWSRASSCSGTVVGPNIVLTAGHCLTAGWDSYSFIPGLSGDSMPYGEWFAAKTRAWVHEAYNNYVASRSTAQNLLDYGFIKFDPVYNNGYSLSATVGSFQVLMAANLLNTPLYSLGYPVEGFASTGGSTPAGGACGRRRGASRTTAARPPPGRRTSATAGSRWAGAVTRTAAIRVDRVFPRSPAASGTWSPSSLPAAGWSPATAARVRTTNGRRATGTWRTRGVLEFRQGWLDALWTYAANA